MNVKLNPSILSPKNKMLQKYSREGDFKENRINWMKMICFLFFVAKIYYQTVIWITYSSL